MASPERESWLNAIVVEEAPLAVKGTFLAPLKHVPANVIQSKRVLAVKRNAKGRIEKYRARLVAHGDMQVEGQDYKETYLPTGCATSHQLLLALAVENEWETHQFDVSSAYLNGNLPNVKLFMQLPNNDVIQLQRALYGLCQVGRKWLSKTGFTCTPHDHAMLVKREGQKCCFLSIHVDDGLLTGNGNLDGVLHSLKQQFDAKSTNKATFFLGQRIECKGKTGAAVISQSHFVKSLLEDHNMSNASPQNTPSSPYSSQRLPLNPKGKPYWTIVG